MSIQYTGDNVAFSSPDGIQTDWEALISINFVRQNTDGSYTAPYLYVQNVTGATSYSQMLDKFKAARSAITDESLLAFAVAQDALNISSTGASPAGSGSGEV